MKNPVQMITEERGATVTQLAILAGVDETRVRQYLRGQPGRLTGKVLDALTRLGYDRDQLTTQYAEWRKALADETMTQLSVR